jgi:hypothetical protein
MPHPRPLPLRAPAVLTLLVLAVLLGRARPGAGTTTTTSTSTSSSSTSTTHTTSTTSTSTSTTSTTLRVLDEVDRLKVRIPFVAKGCPSAPTTPCLSAPVRPVAGLKTVRVEITGTATVETRCYPVTDRMHAYEVLAEFTETDWFYFLPNCGAIVFAITDCGTSPDCLVTASVSAEGGF